MNIALLSQTDTANAIEALGYFIDGLSNDIKSQSVVYIASEPDIERQFFNPIADMYRRIGFNNVDYIELEQGFDAVKAKRLLADAGLVHLSGGDTFRFLYWLKQRELDCYLYHLAQDGLPIIGVSAGAMVLTPDISSAVLCGDRNTIGLDNTLGLNLTPFQFVPHVNNPHKPTSQMFNFVTESQQELLLCSDDDAVVFHSGINSVKQSHIRYFGEPNLLEITI